MDQPITRTAHSTLESSPQEHLLKQTKPTDWSSIHHPEAGGSSVSTASGAPTTFSSSSSFSAAFTPPFEENGHRNFTGSTFTNSRCSSNWTGSSCSTGGAPYALKHHYIGVLHSAASAPPLTSLGFPSSAVSVTDTSPAWAQYQFTSSSSSSSGSVTGCCTPLYCSLSPTPTPAALHLGPSFSANEEPSSPEPPDFFGEESRRQGEGTARAAVAATAASTASARAGATAEAWNSSPCAASPNAGRVRRRWSLLLNEQPLSVTSLPLEVQAALQQDRGTSCRSSSVPEWFDIQTGCIKKELLPQLPSFRSTLNTSVARLSAASRVHHRVRWPGEPAKATTASTQQLHPKLESAAAATRNALVPSAAAVPGASGPVPGALLRRKSDSFALALHSRGSSPTELRSISHNFAHESTPTASLGAADATAQPQRCRRVRFATMPSAVEYREPSPYGRSGGASPPTSPRGVYLPAPSAAHISSPQEAEAAAASAPTAARGGGSVHSTSTLLKKMTLMIQRLLDYPPLQRHHQSKDSLQDSLRLFHAFGEECMGRHPSLSYFGDCLERCEQLVKTKLPEEEEGPLKDLVQTAAASLLSREAVLKLHRMRLQLQHPPEMELFLTPLETLQRVRIYDRRRATSGLRLHAATADEALLEGEMRTNPNVFLLKGFACGVVSTRRWHLSQTPRAFAASVLLQLQQLLQQMQEQRESALQGSTCPFTSGLALPVGFKPSMNFPGQTHFRLTHLVETALRQTTEKGCCSLGVLSMDESGEKLRFATSGFMRLLVLRRSAASGILCRIAEAPVRNVAIATESQLFKWPSVKELLNKSNTDNASFRRREYARSEKTNKVGVDKGARKQGLMRVVEWADTGEPWSCRGLVEQEVFVQEGDFFVVADEILFEVVTCEEMRHLFSCCLASVEGEDATDVSLCIAPSCLCLLLKRLWRQRVPHLQVLLNKLEERKQKLVVQAAGRRGVNGTLDAYPLDLSIAAGWLRKPRTKDTNAQTYTNQNANTEADISIRAGPNAEADTYTDPNTYSDPSRDS